MRPLHLMLSGFTAIGLAATAAFVFAPSRDVVAAIHIDAQPDRVWAVLTDTAAYPAWNPGMTLAGAPSPGSTITHTEGQGADRMVFHPVIVASSPPRELSWRGQLAAPGILDVLHAFRLSPESGGTRFVQSEHPNGVLLWMWNAGQLLPKFQAMNAALKSRAEKWRSGGPASSGFPLQAHGAEP
jgi:hypothetical protein